MFPLFQAHGGVLYLNKPGQVGAKCGTPVVLETPQAPTSGDSGLSAGRLLLHDDPTGDSRVLREDRHCHLLELTIADKLPRSYLQAM